MTTQSISPSELASAQYYSRAETLQTLNRLGQALQSGNLDQAKANYAELQDHCPEAFQSGNTSTGQAFAALGSALQSGSVSDAQQTFEALVQQLYKSSHRAQPLPPDAAPSQDASSDVETSSALDVTA